MQCPNCGSNNTQKSSAFHDQNVRVTEGRSAGAFITSKGSIGLGRSSNVSRSSSAAADLNAPYRTFPLRSYAAIGLGFAAALLILNAGGGFFLFLFAILGSFFTAIYLSTPTEEERREQARYDLQWYCKKCGHIFFANEGSSAPATRTSAANFVSPVMRSASAAGRRDYIDRVVAPVQWAKQATDRDLAGLAAIQASANPDGSFEPEKLRCDLGVISRLASLELITYDAATDRFLLSHPDTDRPHRGWWQRTFG